MAKSKLLRVTQINAVYFDKEVFKEFKHHLEECLKYLPVDVTSKFEPELNFLLRIGILSYSILNHNCSFGQKLLSIKYDNLSSTKKYFFVFANVYNYMKEKMESSTPSHFINTYFHKIDVCIQLLRLINISLFLRGGEKPQLIERFLCLNQDFSKNNVQRHYEDKYMTRELIWNGFIEILVYLLPLINYQKMTRMMRHWNPVHKKPKVANVHRKLTLETKCAVCGQFPIHPSHMGCCHIFCYFCLKGNQMADVKYECPTCEFSTLNPICHKMNCK
ncbi:PREDICTED: peroxisome biogenesis factor 2 [Nicrophorus vespilloides]|uniref:RING-type E3 ubiquitin transferase (cysteine targeting) n=1 Tax=Nicrophorus vespilloides TaxID=110193 RepID=A0ABM1NCX8_NICVS|nr:PREDICTED: peroxisome biogenesis factor 2 [Nicrophorus vespilloides]